VIPDNRRSPGRPFLEKMVDPSRMGSTAATYDPSEDADTADGPHPVTTNAADTRRERGVFADQARFSNRSPRSSRCWRLHRVHVHPTSMTMTTRTAMASTAAPMPWTLHCVYLPRAPHRGRHA